MNDIMQFSDRAEFRQWLSDNCRSGAGVWLLFGKAGGPKTIGAGEALEEALCFGWIDGRMQSIDDTACDSRCMRHSLRQSGNGIKS